MWSGQFVSTMGSALTSLASSILVYRLTGSAASVGLMLIATAAPSMLVGLFAGVFVDRFDRRRIMIVADILRAVLVLLIPFLVPHSIVWLYVIVALTSAIGQFYDPAHESILPEVATEEELASANSLMAISSFGSTAIGFAASGLIAAAADIRWAFYLDALTFVVSMACIIMIRVKHIPADESASVKMVVRNLKAGMQHLINTPILRSLFLVAIPVMISFGFSNALLLPFSAKALGASEFVYGIQEALTSLGFVVASLLMAGTFDRMREGPWIALSFIGMGVVGAFYSAAHSIPLAILLVTISGFLNAPSTIGRRLVIQRNTPREMRGRVNSAFFVARDLFFIVGMALVGLADFIDLRLLFLLGSLLTLAAGVWVLFLPGLRQEAAEWRRALQLLRSAQAPGLGVGRSASLADLDRLIGLLPPLAVLDSRERGSLAASGRILEAPPGATVIHHGETGDAAYFILSGKAVAGIADSEGGYRSLANLEPGDFFGEIAALTGARRTANVVADEPTTLMQVPAGALRKLMDHPDLGQLFLAKMTERITMTQLSELPRIGGYDQQSLRSLRSAPGEPEAA
jgi:CRP-like cAMP-binding protein/sugar phosphate permease